MIPRGPAEAEDRVSEDKSDKDRDEVDGAQRGRPGRRSVEERKTAVLELISGQATVDQLARRFGVRPETIDGWRTDALAGIEEALRRGTGRTEREVELEKENRELRDTVTDLSIDRALLRRELDKCRPPSAPVEAAPTRLPGRPRGVPAHELLAAIRRVLDRQPGGATGRSGRRCAARACVRVAGASGR